MRRSTALQYLFEGYSLDTDRRELRRGEGIVPVEPQVFDLLTFLVRATRHRVSNPRGCYCSAGQLRPPEVNLSPIIERTSRIVP
jgi:hypothetical protein